MPQSEQPAEAMPHPRHARTQLRALRAFTLIELLVVIAILSLLVALLLPSLQKAKELAKAVECAARSRNIGIAHMMYATENSETITYAAWLRPPSYGGGAISWDDNLAIFLGVTLSQSDKNSYNSRNAWGQSYAILSCPKDPYALQIGRTYKMICNTNWFTHYTDPATDAGGQVMGGVPNGTGGTGVGQTYKVANVGASDKIFPPRLSDIKAAAKTLLGSESTSPTAATAGSTYDSGIQWAYHQNTKIGQTLHGGTFNFLFSEGHVERLRTVDTVEGKDAARADPAVQKRASNGYWSINPLDDP